MKENLTTLYLTPNTKLCILDAWKLFCFYTIDTENTSFSILSNTVTNKITALVPKK